MARTDITVTNQMARAGLNLAAALPNAAAVDGHSFADNGRRVLRVKNTDGTAKTVTLQIPGQVDGQDITDRQVIVPATSGDVLIGPFTAPYRRGDGKIWVDYSAITGVTVALYEIPA